MSAPHYENHYSESTEVPHNNGFFLRFKKNLVIELLAALKGILILYAYISTILYAVTKFFLAIKEVKEVVGYVLLPFIIYYTGKYLTLLPTALVIVLIFTPARITWSILGLAMFFSFFMVFLV